MNSYRIPEAGAHYIPEIKQKCFWELVIRDREILLVQRGGPLEPVALSIEINETGNLEVSDCWEWGNG